MIGHYVSPWVMPIDDVVTAVVLELGHVTIAARVLQPRVNYGSTVEYILTVDDLQRIRRTIERYKNPEFPFDSPYGWSAEVGLRKRIYAVFSSRDRVFTDVGVLVSERESKTLGFEIM